MSKIQRKEYQETKVVKTLSPIRGTRGGSAQNLAQFDNNLDYLLEDLQSSVSRPTSTLGNTGSNTYRETRVTSNVDHGRTNSLNRVTHLKASNPVTEYSSDDSYSYTAPDGSKSVKSFKKESYYTSTGDGVAPEKIRMQNNINQLDSLLDDLKQVKQGGANNSVGIDPGLVETGKTRVMMGKKIVERELHYGDTPPRAHTLDRSDREGSVTREIQYIDEGTYGETRPIRYSPSPSQSQTSTLTKQKKVTNVHQYPLEVLETTTPDINPEILANLDPNLIPAGNTKVTTTIKTYTYEIPGSGYKPATISPDSEKYVYSPNQSQTTPSRSFIYSKVENNDVTNTIAYPIVPAPERTLKTNVYKETTTSTQSAPPYQRPTPPPGAETSIIKETTTTRNYQPGYQVYPEPPPPSKQTYIYNETTTTKNINEGYPNDYPVKPREPPRSDTYIIKETHNTTTNKTSPPYSNGYPPQEPPGSTTVIYKHDTHTTNIAPPPRRQTPPNTTVIYNKTETNTTENYDPNNRYPGHPGDSPRSKRPIEPPHDPNNVNITYKYTSHSSTQNKYGGGYPPNEESLPLLRPQPFPSDGEIDGPPKRVEELMAKIGGEPPDSPLNSGFSAHEAELVHQKKVDTLKNQHQATEVNDLQKKERNLPPTKNITGPAVYYPPGHELFAHKEESGGGAWRAEGGMARESGKYKYEAESSSKSKSRSGAAIIPVCLPLCCGIPCTII